ncbi:uncharacterized protein LOC124154380 isoform X2 [Ischnura elegans]|uniref:uncharacterized protein LOC124154380 isoform X2 n=1 Tax=Ischnura elegans TaxID=197161 RepID=UPI001ED87C60|nr:uncharacterized protein LOC124154380 isoform X2 [Ischnura elegans]
MASLTQLFIIGFIVILLTFDPCSATNAPERNLTECERFAMDPKIDVFVCMQMEFTTEKIEEAAKHFNNSECPRCQQFCSRRQSVLECIHERATTLSRILPRAKEMTEFMVDFFESGIPFVCDNNATMLAELINEENDRCIRENAGECKKYMSMVRMPSYLSFCENQDQANDLSFGKQTCQGVISYLECSKATIEPCSSGLKNFVGGAVSTFKDNGACAKYDL